jgi:hypothetical protein
VIGEFGQITNDIPLCVTKQHQRPLVTYGLTQDMIDKAPPGLLVTPDILPDRRVKVIMSLLKTRRTFAGKTVAILGDSGRTRESTRSSNPRCHRWVSSEARPAS